MNFDFLMNAYVALMVLRDEQVDYGIVDVVCFEE